MPGPRPDLPTAAIDRGARGRRWIYAAAAGLTLLVLLRVWPGEPAATLVAAPAMAVTAAPVAVRDAPAWLDPWRASELAVDVSDDAGSDAAEAEASVSAGEGDAARVDPMPGLAEALEELEGTVDAVAGGLLERPDAVRRSELRAAVVAAFRAARPELVPEARREQFQRIKGLLARLDRDDSDAHPNEANATRRAP